MGTCMEKYIFCF